MQATKRMTLCPTFRTPSGVGCAVHAREKNAA